MNEKNWEKVIVVCAVLTAILAIVASVLFRMWIIKSDLPLWLKLVLWG